VVGDGADVPDGATVKCDYSGWLLEGKLFDSSWHRELPAEFSLAQVVKGWGMGIPGMKVGGIRKLVIPPHLGYGDPGQAPDIPPRATLVFEVQVLEIKDNMGGGGMPPNPHGRAR
jgi:FKBP-type peptidyl-prolyl cis-trans isomerase